MCVTGRKCYCSHSPSTLTFFFAGISYVFDITACIELEMQFDNVSCTSTMLAGQSMNNHRLENDSPVDSVNLSTSGW
jgi:hypothetical protein